MGLQQSLRNHSPQDNRQGGLPHILLRCIRDHLLRLLAAYIDLKEVFDMVQSESPWEILKLRVIPTNIFGLILVPSVIKCGGGLSRFFPDSSEVRQGCVLAPILFNTCIDCLLGRPTVQSHCGATLGNIKTKIQDFGNLLEPVQLEHACGKDIKVTECFTYLGSVVHNSGLSDQEVTRWIGLVPGSRQEL
ncbi:uncharacterized protein [Penaeus vannamei]|uniref:uncharacterized protein n=1 Tax=Penaeus vannamei TaxID=6689 RepID=UPI00387F54E6